MRNPVLHQTDLFHQHGDPDDHWDLACQFALAYSEETDLKGVLIDYPPDFQYGDPSIQSVSQMNYITGLSVPISVGIPKSKMNEDIINIDWKQPGYGGVKMILRTLEESKEAVIIYIVGSCRDISVAGSLRPELFKEKCKAIYLNAGSAIDNGFLEYNVTLDPLSYSAIFKIPCPIYWMPCFEEAPASFSEPFRMGTYGTYYNFSQKEILPELSDKVQKYFCYALGRIMDTKWLTYLSNPKNQSMIDFYSNLERNMWCTGGFFHGAGKAVTLDGDIVNLDEDNKDLIFSFEPITAFCEKNGAIKWDLTNEPTDRFIYKVKDVKKYKAAMTKALRTLLQRLP